MPARIGQRYLGRYDVLERIGEGGFAHVFRARDVARNTDVALKVLKEPLRAEGSLLERCQREVFAKTVVSPHVVAVHEFSISGEGGDVYMVMDLIEGPSLRQLMGTRQWSASDVQVIVGQIAHALEAAHVQGAVHRDLKPENVLMARGQGQGWQVRVLDFGLAKLAELERSLDPRPVGRRGASSGTPQYLAPEQILDQPCDGGVDLFALGVVTYEMLAGYRPWDGVDPREVTQAIVQRRPPATASLHASVARRAVEINQFFARALAKQRAERPVDAPTFFRELEQALFGEERSLVPLAEMPSRSIAIKVAPPSDVTEVDLAPLPIESTGVGPRPHRSSSDSQMSTLPFLTAQVPRQPARPSSLLIVAFMVLLASAVAAALWLITR